MSEIANMSASSNPPSTPTTIIVAKMEDYPAEIIVQIIVYLELKDVLRLREACSPFLSSYIH